MTSRVILEKIIITSGKFNVYLKKKKKIKSTAITAACIFFNKNLSKQRKLTHSSTFKIVQMYKLYEINIISSLRIWYFENLNGM